MSSDPNGDLNYWGDWLTETEDLSGNVVIAFDGGSIKLLGVSMADFDFETWINDDKIKFDLPEGHYAI